MAGIDALVCAFVDELNCFSDSSLLTRDFGFGSTHWIDVPCYMLVGFPAKADAYDNSTSMLSRDANLNACGVSSR